MVSPHLVFCCIYFFALALKADTLTLNLSQAVSYALNQVPALASAQREKEISALATKTARFSFFPKFLLSASSGLNTAKPLWPIAWNNGLSLSLQQPILSHSVNNISYEKARVKEGIAHFELENQRLLLCMKVVKDFYAYSAAVQQLAIKRQKFEALFKQLDLVTHRFLQGIKTQRDVVRFQAQVQQARIQQATTKNRVDQSKEQLISTITGVNRQALKESFEFEPIEASMPAVDLIPSREPPIENHPLFKKLELEQKIASLDLDLSRRQLWPELSAGATAQGGASFGIYKAPSFEPSASFYLGFSLSYELFDFGRQRRDIAIAMKNQEIKANSTQTKLSTETAVITQMMVSFSLLKESLLLNNKLLKLEEENFKRIQNDYLQGKAQYLDLISALNNLSDVKSALYSAIFDLEILLITYRYYEGTLYDSFL